MKEFWQWFPVVCSVRQLVQSAISYPDTLKLVVVFRLEGYWKEIGRR